MEPLRARAGLTDGGYAARPLRPALRLRAISALHREQALDLAPVAVRDQPHLADRTPSLTGEQELARAGERRRCRS